MTESIEKEVDGEKVFLPLIIMKSMNGFSDLNKILEHKFNKKMLVKGESKLKNYLLRSDNLLFEWDNDITEFRINGSATLYEKSFFKEKKISNYNIKINYLNKEFFVDPNTNRSIVLSLVCLIILEAIRAAIMEEDIKNERKK